MIETALQPEEEAFLEELDQYINKWVAILNYDCHDQRIVASGESIREARKEAEAKGFKDLTFFKVPSPDRLFVPAINASET